MSGIEVIGVLASASQLAAYCIRIALQLHETYARVRTNPKRTREHLQQVSTIIQTTTLIENNIYLRVPSVKIPLQNTLLEAQILHKLLNDLNSRYAKRSLRKYWAVVSGVGQD